MSRTRQENDAVVLLGCTAVGKTDAAVLWAERIGAQIVCVDSMQVYRRMDVGTGKPSHEQRQRVRHHLIDVVEPSESFTAARYVEAADAAIADIRGRGRTPLLVAGTPFYLMGLIYGLFEGPSADAEFRRRMRARAAVEGTGGLHAELAAIDPEAAARIHPNDMARIERALEVYHHTGRPISALQQQWSRAPRFAISVVGIRRATEDLSRRINARVRDMIAAGLADEVRSLLAEPAGLSIQARQALGYAEIIAHLEGRWTLDEAIEQIKINTRRFAKSQRTWFRRFREARWIDAAADEPAERIVEKLNELRIDG